jgi:hypothetical protein
LKIHLSVTTLEPTGRGTRSKVLLAIKTTKSSSMTRHQFELARVAQMEEGTDDKVGTEVADSVSLLAKSRKPHFSRVVIG